MFNYFTSSKSVRLNKANLFSDWRKVTELGVRARDTTLDLHLLCV